MSRAYIAPYKDQFYAWTYVNGEMTQLGEDEDRQSLASRMARLGYEVVDSEEAEDLFYTPQGSSRPFLSRFSSWPIAQWSTNDKIVFWITLAVFTIATKMVVFHLCGVLPHWSWWLL